eukprot:scaffold297524_cov19-Tisochrysis_lutea.AAC.1
MAICRHRQDAPWMLEFCFDNLSGSVWEKHFLPAVQVEPSSTYDRNFLRITLTDLEEPGAVFVSYRYERHQAALHMCSKFLRILSTIKINMWQKLRSRLALSPCYSEVGANIALLEMSCLLLISKKKHEAAGISGFLVTNAMA